MKKRSRWCKNFKIVKRPCSLNRYYRVGADKSARNTPKFICPSSKVWDFDEKRLHWASVVRVWMHVQSGEALLRHNNIYKTETQNS